MARPAAAAVDDRSAVDALVAVLFREEAGSLVRLARFFVDDREAAEDLVQEAFIRLARSAHRIRERDRAAAYLRSIVLNLARDHNRRGLVSLRHRPPADPAPASVEEEVVVRVEQQLVIEALRELPRRQRDCLVLRYYLELPVAGIAETLGLSANSVKTHLQRGLRAGGAAGGEVRMTMLEHRLQSVLKAEADTVAPAPDLFSRVQGSIEDDRRRWSQRWRGAAVITLLLGALGAVVFAVSDINEGRLLMDWWVLEAITTAILVGLALWLGPFIKRFGRSYAADVFRANPRTGKSYIILADLVYYLIFSAYILFTVRFEPPLNWPATVGAGQLQHETARVGGILLIIGVPHGLNILIMPVLGRLFFSLSSRFQTPAGSGRSETVD